MNYFAVARDAIILVEGDAIKFRAPGFLVVNTAVNFGFNQFIQDISKGTLRMSEFDTLVLIIGRSDLSKHRDWRKIEQKLVNTLRVYNKSTTVVSLGPFPQIW